MSVPELERRMGIEVYLTKTEGLGGSIRREIHDFVVEENLVDGSKATVEAPGSGKSVIGATAERQPFLLCVLVKRNWDTFLAIRNVARELGVSQASIQIAGIKDAKAATAQFVTIEDVTADEAAGVRVRDVELRPVGYVREAMSSFYLLGNSFKIVVRGINRPKTALEQCISACMEEIASAGGIPNFYGHQRFGTTRAITHQVGKALVSGNLEEAVMIFLGQPSEYEHPESSSARAALWESRDFQRAFKEFPRQLRFERLMLSHLAGDPQDFARAFHRLPQKLQLLFVQAYQSYLFNRFLSQRIQHGWPLNSVTAGDYVVHVDRSGLPMPQTGKRVDETKLAETNKQMSDGKLRLALPIVGFAQKLSQGEAGELQHRVLDEEGVEPRNFRVSALPEVGARGELRAAVAPVREFSAGVVEDIAEKMQLWLQFTLLKSSYATVLLREMMKPCDPVSAGF